MWPVVCIGVSRPDSPILELWLVAVMGDGLTAHTCALLLPTTLQMSSQRGQGHAPSLGAAQV